MNLVIGASGQVGDHLVRVLEEQGQKVVGTFNGHPVSGYELLDIRRRDAVQHLMTSVHPSIVYIPASLTNVDTCEQYPDEGYAVNVGGLCNVVEVGNAIGARLVYFSSDYIFDGKSGPYAEDDPANPICEYGRQKLMAEHYLALHAANCLIVRTTIVYGWERLGKNFVSRLVNTLQLGQTLKVPVDQIGNPTYASNLAQVVVEMVNSGADGVFHVVGPERASRYEFALEAAHVFGLDEKLILPVTTPELGQLASRPLNAGMTSVRIAAVADTPMIGYREGLQKMLTESLA